MKASEYCSKIYHIITCQLHDEAADDIKRVYSSTYQIVLLTRLKLVNPRKESLGRLESLYNAANAALQQQENLLNGLVGK